MCDICDGPVARLGEPTRQLLYCFIDGDPNNQAVQIEEAWQCERYLAHLADDNFEVGPPKTTSVRVSGQQCQSVDCQRRAAAFIEFWDLHWAEQERRAWQPLDIEEGLLLDVQARGAGYHDGFNELELHARNKYPAMWLKDRNLAMKIVMREHHQDVDFSTVQNFPMHLGLGE